jgi:8-oxo-dGTP pyrophosphatase MutT (NUDIX family)
VIQEIQYITVKAVITVGDRILLLQDKKGNWELPGGRINFGETPEQTLQREISEELGIKESKINGIASAWSFVVSSLESKRQYIVLVYRCEIPSTGLSISNEHLSAKWALEAEIGTLEMRQGYRDAISGALGRAQK